MKVCETCGDEIATRDGDNKCAYCKHKTVAIKRKAAKKAREDALRSCGLVKVRGSMGGIYWE